MSYHRNDLTAEYVRSILDYNPDTGILTWKDRLVKYGKRTRRSGKPAGRVNGGRIGIGIKTHRYLGHRLAWLIMTGDWPNEEIDHKDGNGLNNRWNNLRIATRFQNQYNTTVRKISKTGFKSVNFVPHTGRYRARITYQGNNEHIGYFDTAEEAYAAYCARAKELHGEFYRQTST